MEGLQIEDNSVYNKKKTLSAFVFRFQLVNSLIFGYFLNDYLFGTKNLYLTNELRFESKVPFLKTVLLLKCKIIL